VGQMPTQTISIDEDLLAILKEKTSANERSLSKEISFRLKQSLKDEESSNNSADNDGDKMT
jgi:hypothetical protein